MSTGVKTFQCNIKIEAGKNKNVCTANDRKLQHKMLVRSSESGRHKTASGYRTTLKGNAADATH